MASLLWSLVAVVGLMFSGAVTETSTGCTPQNEGKIVERGCWGYTRCVNGEPDTTSCPTGFVFDVVSRKCVDQVGRTENCGLCDGLNDGTFPDILEDCKTYFTCMFREASNEQRCPIGMVFDERYGKCNIKFFVPPPCGTLGQ